MEYEIHKSFLTDEKYGVTPRYIANDEIYWKNKANLLDHEIPVTLTYSQYGLNHSVRLYHYPIHDVNP